MSGVVVPYIGTWVETQAEGYGPQGECVVPYIGTWIETGVRVSMTI